jgi:hypothetical protein
MDNLIDRRRLHRRAGRARLLSFHKPGQTSRPSRFTATFPDPTRNAVPTPDLTRSGVVPAVPTSALPSKYDDRQTLRSLLI